MMLSSGRATPLEAALEVHRPPHEVFAYCSDLSRTPEWNGAVVRAARVTDGPLGVGSRFRVKPRGKGTLDFTVVGWQPDRRVRMKRDAGPPAAFEELLFEPTADGTRVRYVGSLAGKNAIAALKGATAAESSAVFSRSSSRPPIASSTGARISIHRFAVTTTWIP